MEKSRPLKIALITNLYPPHARGGAERVVELIAQELQNQGHEVVIITTAAAAFQISNFKSQIYYLRPWNLFWYGDIDRQPLWKRTLWRLIDLYNISSARQVAKIFFKEHPHIVITHNLVGLGYQIPQMLRRFRAKHVHTLHDVQLVAPSGKLWFNQKIRWYHRVYARICRRLFGSPSVVVSPSQWLLDFYVQHGFFEKSKRVVLQNPLPTIFAIAKNIGTPPQEESRLRVLFVGQLEEHKGILFLIEAFKKSPMPNAQCPMSLDIVGSGTLQQRVQALVQGDTRITMHGLVAHDALEEFYSNADVVVVPSLVAENQPTVILEAFSHGVPVIASRIGGIPELVGAGKTGFLFPPGDMDALVAIFHRVATEPKTLSEMQRAIRERKIGLSPKEYVEQLLSFCHPEAPER